MLETSFTYSENKSNIYLNSLAKVRDYNKQNKIYVMDSLGCSEQNKINKCARERILILIGISKRSKNNLNTLNQLFNRIGFLNGPIKHEILKNFIKARRAFLKPPLLEL